MKAHIKQMKDFLNVHGINARVGYCSNGSLAGSWLIRSEKTTWSKELMEKLTNLGFVTIDYSPLTMGSGGAGLFHILARFKQ